ncbi:hypothetical protein IA57_09870 [Mangrovimonas yunxiaonensis]|uniref:Glycosyltransferase n=1 Tax=Mangrovimonas yunxiaonensis TaxID=1197477 RepID=A0A084TJ66_9FLAO|nr:glycosyltransferase family 4 protein [Mangrovimonas yunxiaonensis]KFB00752.1 hypothetical protein IA57_09870 [Mangrovimonas yunxiaonensis]GGH45920.1 glycoside hydrolase [Mangrovimonas yunxiaonensis]
MKKNILIVTSEFPPLPGGIGNHAHQLAFHLSQQGHQVTVLADYRTYEQQEESQFDLQQPYTVNRISRKKNRWLMYLNRIKSYRQMYSKADVVLASGKFSLWLVGLGSVGFKKRPKLAVLHGTEVNFQKPLLKWSINQALRQFHKAIAVSQFTANLVKNLPLEVQIIPNGITLEDWQQQKTVQKREEQDFPILITVGNLTERKGQANVIKMMPQLLEQYPNLRYDCVGLPTELKALEQLTHELGVAERVHFHGRLSDQELKEKLLQSDVFVMLSQQTSAGDVEGFGIAILEANALGIPTIGALGSGIEAAIAQGKSGFLVPNTDAQAFEKALQAILKAKEQFRQGALQRAEAHNWKVIVKQYLEVIEALFV